MQRTLSSVFVALCACSVFPDHAVLPGTGDAGSAGAGRGGLGGHAGHLAGGASGYAGDTTAGESGHGGAPDSAGMGGAGASGGKPSQAGSSGAGVLGGAGGQTGGGTGGSASCASPVIQTLAPEAVSWLEESAPKAMHGAEPSLRIASIEGERAHTLVRFDLGVVSSPPLEARLLLVPESVPEAARAVAVHALTSEWSALQATWQRARPGVNWSRAGGDFAPTATAVVDISALRAGETAVSWDVTRDVVDHVERGIAGFGWLVRDVEQEAPALHFGGIDGIVASPSLVVVTCP